jgi:hypothetical protein
LLNNTLKIHIVRYTKWANKRYIELIKPCGMCMGSKCSNMFEVMSIGLGPHAYEGSLKLQVLEAVTWAWQTHGHYRLHAKVYHVVLNVCHIKMLSIPSNQFHGAGSFKNYSATQDIHCLFWSPQIHRHVLSHMNPVGTNSFISISILFSHLQGSIPRSLLPSHSMSKFLITPLVAPTHATCPNNLILFQLNTLTVFPEIFKS